MDRTLDKALAALRDENVENRLAAIETIIGSGKRALLPYLIESLGDPEWRVRKTAVGAIIRIGPEEDLIDRLLSIFNAASSVTKKNTAAEALVGLGEACLHPIFRALPPASAEVKKFLIEILGEIKNRQSTDELLGLLHDPDENVRLATIEAIGKIGDKKAVDHLLPLLDQPDPLIGFAAIKALEQIGDVRAGEAVLQAARSRELERVSIEALGTLGDHHSTDFLVRSILFGTHKSRSAALRSLVKIVERSPNKTAEGMVEKIRAAYNEEWRRFLGDVLTDADDKTALAAVKVLGWVGDPRLGKKVARFLSGPHKEDALKTLVRFGREVVPDLMSVLPEGNDEVREGIARALGAIGDREAVGALTLMLGDGTGHVREAAAKSLGLINDPTSARALLALLQDDYASVQESAIEALCHFKNREVIYRLLDLTENPRAGLRKHAIRILGRMRAGEAVQKIVLAIKDEDPGVRKVAVEALGFFDSPEVDPMLILTLGDEDQEVRLTALSIIVQRPGIDFLRHIEPLIHDENIWMRTETARALGHKKGPLAKALLIKLLKDKVGVVQIAAIESLGELGDPETPHLILDLTRSQDVEVMKAAILGLGETKQKAYGPKIQAFLTHPDWGVRAAAVKALGKLGDTSARSKIEAIESGDPDRLVRNAAQFALSQMTES
jgi:HEAT repeat protein